MDLRNSKLITPQIIAEYCYSHTSDPNELLDEIKVKTERHGHMKMMSGDFLGRFLSLMSKVMQPRVILEVGSFTGYGTMCLAEGLHPEGRLITIEKNPELKGFSSDQFSRMKPPKNITQLIGDASEIIGSLEETFDLVFIDAAKRQYIDYYEAILPKLRSGGVILADNTLWKGTVTDEHSDKLGEGIKRFNTHVKDDDRVTNILLPIDDGVNFIMKN